MLLDNAHRSCVVHVDTQVGPYTNPSETYPFYSLPFCRPESVERESQELGDVLAGDRRVNTLYKIQFKGERVGVGRSVLSSA